MEKGREEVYQQRARGLGSDEDISAAVTPVATPTSVMPSGPITRARARQINGQVLSFLYKYDLANEDIILRSYSDLLVLRNKGEIKDEDTVHSDQMEQHSCMHVTSHPCTCMKCTKGLGLTGQHHHVVGPLAFGHTTRCLAQLPGRPATYDEQSDSWTTHTAFDRKQ